MSDTISIFDLFTVLISHCNVNIKIKDVLDAMNILSGIPLSDADTHNFMKASAKSFDMEATDENADMLLNGTVDEFIGHMESSQTLRRIAAVAKEI